MGQRSRKYANLPALLRNHWLYISVLVLGILASIFLWEYTLQKNFDPVVSGKIYRSGQPGEAQLERWIKNYKLKTIISLRHTLPAYEKDLAARYHINLHQIVLSSRKNPSEEKWQRIRNLLTNEENLPLLYHCNSGVDRAGLITALYRIEIQGWPLWRALLEMNLHYHIPFYRPIPQQYILDRFKADSADFEKEAPDLLPID